MNYDNAKGKLTLNFTVPTTIGIIFIVLKLVGIIEWSWWWVLAPIYGPITIVLSILALFLFIGWIIDRLP